MKIAQIAPLWYSIPPEKYGGTERVIHNLTEGLVKAGHDVTLFASGDSQTSANLVATRPTALIKSGVPWRDSSANMYNFAQAMEQADQFDVIHSHMHLNAAFFSKFINTPIVHTMHNIPGLKDWRWEIFQNYKDIYNPVFISKKQMENAKNYSGIEYKNSWVVYNSVDTDHFAYNEKPDDYFVWLGLITKVKGIENAIAAAKKAGSRLKLAGKPNDHDSSYFDKVIKPLLDDKIEFVGELGGQDLVNFYQGAKALVFPIEWEEPFGLVMTEAMSCGTPVIAYKRGSVPEIVEDGKNGFIVENIDGIVEAMKNIDSINRQNCRQTVLDKFTNDIMAKQYEQIYKEIVQSNA